MKKLLMIILATVSFQVAQAQIRLGIKGGVNLATYSGSDADDVDMLTSFHAGLLVNFEFTDMISLQPEIIYSIQGAKGDFLGVEVTSQQDYINIPVMLQLKFGGLYGEIGPQLGILMSSEESGGGVSIDSKDSFTSTDIGAGIGVGYKMEGGLGLGARYMMGLTSLDGTDDGIDTDIKNSVISVSILYTFGNK